MLHRKLARDLVQLSGQAITIALVVACGIGIFVAAASTHHSLVRSHLLYYAETHFADVFGSLKRAPASLEKRIAELPGVGQIETRNVFDVMLLVNNISLPLSGRIVALPELGMPKLNRLMLRGGRFPQPDRADEAIVSEAFAEANGLGPGSSLDALLNGKLQTLRIVGVVVSPEYVFASPPNEPIPDDKRFGVLWMNHEPAAAAFDMTSAFNDVAIALAPGARSSEVETGLDRLLEPYGGLVSYDRSQQPSHRFLSDEIRQQQRMATTIPVIFLAVAAFLMNVVLSRMVAAQREQIASLKALGYFDGTIAMHYMAFALVIALGGIVLGIGLGVLLGRMMTESYTLFMRLPTLAFSVEPWVPPVAAASAVIAALAGALSAVRSVLRLAPAQAMRPPAPAPYQTTLIDQALPARRLGIRWLIPIRGIAGRPVRTALTVLGIALAVPLVMVSLFWRDALDYMVNVQFNLAERASAVVSFTDPVSGAATRGIAHMAGVSYAEGTRFVPVNLRAGRNSYRTVISGLGADTRLRRLLDADLNVVAVPPGGLLLSKRLATRLDVARGDHISSEVLEAERPRVELIVSGLVDDLVGLSAYMDRSALNRLMREADAISSVAVMLDPMKVDEFYREVKAAPKVRSVSIKALSVKSFLATTASFVLVLATIFTAFASTIAVGVVYNGVRVAFQERSWELASLRVLGFTRSEVSWILLGETALEALFAIPLGLFFGYWMVRALSAWHETEMFEIPPIIEPRTYVFGAGIVLLAGLVSALIVRRRIDQMDLVSVLKARE
jgi:putative ABC transport system permease protein